MASGRKTHRKPRQSSLSNPGLSGSLWRSHEQFSGNLPAPQTRRLSPAALFIRARKTRQSAISDARRVRLNQSRSPACNSFLRSLPAQASLVSADVDCVFFSMRINQCDKVFFFGADCVWFCLTVYTSRAERPRTFVFSETRVTAMPSVYVFESRRIARVVSCAINARRAITGPESAPSERNRLADIGREGADFRVGWTYC